MDIVFVNPGKKRETYQLLDEFSAFEPPFLIASFAAFLRNRGFSVDIIDANVEGLSYDEVALKAEKKNPELVAVIVYGNHPSASTPNMSSAGEICKSLKKRGMTVVIGGLHPSALPEKTLLEEDVDFVIEGEEQIPLLELLEYIKGKRDIRRVRGIWYRDKNGNICTNPRPPLIKDLDEYLPLAAWDLLPMEKYRAHNWHCFDNLDDRNYAAIYTSLGCPFNCSFCCINAHFGKPGIRYRSAELVVKEIEFLNTNYGIRNFKIIDEMFVLNERHYMGIVEMLAEKKLDLNIWAYTRADTVKFENLVKMREAGFRWLCIGVESASKRVRESVNKKLKFDDIERTVSLIKDAGIYVLANYMFGLWDDDFYSMNETLFFAIQLNTEFANFYPVIPFPGSKLYYWALQNGFKLPKRWAHYSPYSKYLIPLPTRYLSPIDVLKFRDYAWEAYFTNPMYLKNIEDKFGSRVLEHVIYMTSKKIERDYEYIRKVLSE